METALKAALAVGTLAVFVVAFGGEANAELSVSSWYGPGFERSTTASGEVYRADARTAAIPACAVRRDVIRHLLGKVDGHGGYR